MMTRNCTVIRCHEQKQEYIGNVTASGLGNNLYKKVKVSYLTSVAKQAKTAFLHGPTMRRFSGRWGSNPEPLDRKALDSTLLIGVFE